MSRPLLLDGFSGAGGAAAGYARAGFEVIGVDHRPQKNYPFEFHETDFFEFVRKHGHEFHVIHASPHCQGYSTLAAVHPDKTYPMEIGRVREAVRAWGRPYVIENVAGARRHMFSPIMLCGSAFGLDVRRHRLFESNMWLSPLPCDHSSQTPRFRSLDSRCEKLACVVGVHGHLNYAGELDLRRAAMGIDWMGTAELSQAIPPAYTHEIGTQLLWHLEGEVAS